MVTIDEFSRVVSEIYASSLSPENWATALADISRILGATGCAMYIGAGTNRSMMSATVPSEVSKSYIEHFHTIDYVIDAVEKSPGGLIHGGQALIALKTHSEFETDFMRPFELTDGLFMRLTVGSTPTSFIAPAPKGRAPFDTAERVKFMGALIPHLEQALRTQRHLVESRKSAGDITAVVDAIRHGIVIVGTARTVVQLNSAAEKILTAGDGLCMRSDRVEATRTSTNEELQGSITRACVEQRNGSRSGDSFACSRASGKRPYVIHVLPVATTEDPSAGRALVMIIDPEQETEPPKVLLNRLFGLTSGEADVALRMLRGDGLKPIAADLALSMATIKTHLHHIFNKTDTHRQAELVRLLLGIIP
ncbi:MAG TPA: helix-turn-helix transcriptional regulator [Mycobacterium sp.]|nr:helix-turn-helix transcriptional regulator [Mycobacterium sp.]